MQLRKIGQKIRDIRRLNQILRILTKHGFGFAIQQLHLNDHAIGRCIIKTRMLRRFTEPPESRAVRLRKVLEELGPTFIKLGQTLRVRPDLVPLDLCYELSKLHYKVPPFYYYNFMILGLISTLSSPKIRGEDVVNPDTILLWIPEIGRAHV